MEWFTMADETILLPMLFLHYSPYDANLAF